MVGVCIVGGGRTFHLTKDNIWRNVVEALQPDPARRHVILETTSTNADCDANPANNSPEKRAECYRQIDETNRVVSTFTAEHPMQLHVDNELNSCDHPLAASHECCRLNTSSMLDPPVGLWGMAQYLRKHLCSRRLLEYEESHGVAFDFVIWLRPDLYFFEPLPPAAYLARAQQRVLVSSKEWGTPIGDFIFLAPRPLIRPFHHALSDCVADGCGGRKGIDMRGIPELRLQRYLDLNDTIAYQTYPFLFTIVRDRHRADCMRLRNEVLYRSFVRDPVDGSRVDPATLCEEMFFKPPSPRVATRQFTRSTIPRPYLVENGSLWIDSSSGADGAESKRDSFAPWRVGKIAKVGSRAELGFAPRVRRLTVEVGVRDAPETVRAWGGTRNMGLLWFEPFNPNAVKVAADHEALRSDRRLAVLNAIPVLAADGAAAADSVRYYRAQVDGCNGVLPPNRAGSEHERVRDSTAVWKGCFSEAKPPTHVLAVRGADALAFVPPTVELSMLRIRAQGAELAVLESFGSSALQDFGVIVLKCQDLPHDSPLLLTTGGHTCAEIVECMRDSLAPRHRLFDRNGNGPHERHCALANPELRELWCIFRRPDRAFVDPQVDTDQVSLDYSPRPSFSCPSSGLPS